MEKMTKITPYKPTVGQYNLVRIFAKNIDIIIDFNSTTEHHLIYFQFLVTVQMYNYFFDGKISCKYDKV